MGNIDKRWLIAAGLGALVVLAVLTTGSDQGLLGVLTNLLESMQAWMGGS